MSFAWERRPTEALPAMTNEYIRLIHLAVLEIANRYAPEIETWMKQNAPWTDQSGNARQTLYTVVYEVSLQAVDIVLSHGVEYGIFLEVCNAGQYAIIGPALDVFAQRIWNDVLALFQ
jgi:hypothetical protein